jgi:hypothetical protein
LSVIRSRPLPAQVTHSLSFEYRLVDVERPPCPLHVSHVRSSRIVGALVARDRAVQLEELLALGS